MGNLSFSACRRIVPLRRAISRLLLLTAACSVVTAAQAAPLPTTTTLTISSSSVAWHAVVTLTASVTANGAPAAAGTVNFCNASAPLCEDTAILGTAQLVGGNATLRIIPAIGVHTYKAIFTGTATAVASTSSSQTLTVTGLYPTTTSIAATGNPSGYGLTATVVGYANHPPVMAGTVSFQDTSAGNYVLGTALLGPPTFAQGFVQAPNSPVPTGNEPSAGATADFNGDGKPDLAIMNSLDDAIVILLGNGDGTFTQGATIPNVTASNCVPFPLNQRSNCSVVAGDFNQDGKADLAATSDFDNTVTILLGHGDGTFVQAKRLPHYRG